MTFMESPIVQEALRRARESGGGLAASLAPNLQSSLVHRLNLPMPTPARNPFATSSLTSQISAANPRSAPSTQSDSSQSTDGAPVASSDTSTSENGYKYALTRQAPAQSPSSSSAAGPTSQVAASASDRAKQVAQWAYNAGWRGDDLITAVAVAMAESGGDPNSRNTAGNYPHGSADLGVWQINDYWNKGFDPNKIMDPQYNAQYAFDTWKKAGWKDWTTYTKGRYQHFMPEARSAVQGVGDQPQPIAAQLASYTQPESQPQSPPAGFDIQAWRDANPQLQPGYNSTSPDHKFIDNTPPANPVPEGFNQDGTFNPYYSGAP